MSGAHTFIGRDGIKWIAHMEDRRGPRKGESPETHVRVIRLDEHGRLTDVRKYAPVSGVRARLREAGHNI